MGNVPGVSDRVRPRKIDPGRDLRWLREAEEREGRLVSAPSEIIPNLMAVVSDELDEFQFDYWAFSPSNYP